MNNSPHSDSSSTQKLSLATKLAFGVGDFGPALVANLLIFSLLDFLVKVAGLDARLAGSVLLFGNVWDAINDPIVGVLSDRTRNRWGRRLPWIVFGAIPFGLTFFLQWLVPTRDQTWLFIYYLAIALLSNTFYTIVNLPYTALTAELTQDYHERTSLNSFRFTFSLTGGVAALALGLGISKLVSDSGQQFLLIGLIGGVVSVIPLLLCAWGLRKRVVAIERSHSLTAQEESVPILDQFKIAFRNRPFLFVIGIYLCAWLAFQNTAAILPFFVVDTLKLDRSLFFVSAIAVQVAALAALPMWTWVSRKAGKQIAYSMGIGVWLIGQLGLYLIPPQQPSWIAPLAILVGLGVSTAYLIPWSMLPDVVDLDELNTGRRREGVFYGFMTLAQKVCRGFGLFIIGIALKYSGFIESTAQDPLPKQPDVALDAIRNVTAIFPVVMLVISLVLVYFYPITETVHAGIMLKLSERKQQAEE
jgi:glycoside/pentoside/hexuronide:cation symporter, GPH family